VPRLAPLIRVPDRGLRALRFGSGFGTGGCRSASGGVLLELGNSRLGGLPFYKARLDSPPVAYAALTGQTACRSCQAIEPMSRPCRAGGGDHENKPNPPPPTPPQHKTPTSNRRANLPPNLRGPLATLRGRDIRVKPSIGRALLLGNREQGLSIVPPKSVTRVRLANWLPTAIPGERHGRPWELFQEAGRVIKPGGPWVLLKSTNP